jgi:protoporphyrinogen oxidase
VSEPARPAPEVVIIGAGPAGLTAAYQLAARGVVSTVLEADGVVGGLSRTVERDGWRFDIGGHRFFTKVRSVEALWHEILPDEDFLLRPRSSRVFYDGKYFEYPLRAMNVLGVLGITEAVRCVASYGWARVRPPKDQSSLEGWVTARFGARLYRTFFKTYNEKLWGVPASEIKADWAAQRIKNLSLAKAVVGAILPQRKSTNVTSLIEEFQYPKYGPGMMWERARDLVEAHGTKVLLHAAVTSITHAAGRATAVTATTDNESTATTTYACDHVISSMPISALLRAMHPPVPADVARAADDLRYRDFLTVALVVPEAAGFPDNWIYVHSPEVQVGRIQNYGVWSPYMVKDGRTCLGLEYFVNEGEGLWVEDDEDLVALERRRSGLCRADAEGVSDVRRRVPRERAGAAGLARRTRAERAPGRPQRDAQVQQPGPLDADGDARGRKHLRCEPRHLVRQRRRAVSRGGSIRLMRALVVLPTYQEAENVEEVLQRVRAAAPDVDVLVVDDNSPDGTAVLARAVNDRLGQIEVLVRPRKDGLGNAVRNGVHVANDRGYDVIVQMDADLSHDPAMIPLLLDRIDRGADVAIGSRYVPGGEIPHWPWYRRAMSRYGNRYAGFVLGMRVHDATSGFRAYRADLLKAIDVFGTRANGYGFLIETAYRMYRRDAVINEVPIIFADRVRGTSKMSLSVIAEELWLVTWWGIRDRVLRRRRP